MAARTGGSVWARVVPPLSLVAVAGACVLFGLSTAPADDPSVHRRPGQAASLALPAWFTAGLALPGGGHPVPRRRREHGAPRRRAPRALGVGDGAAMGGLLNVVGYANSNIWWAANPTAIRQSAAVLLATAILALVVVGSERLTGLAPFPRADPSRPGWRRAAG